MRSIMSKHINYRRDYGTMSESAINILVALLTMIFFGLLFIAVLAYIRNSRRQQRTCCESLRTYNDATRPSNHRRIESQAQGLNEKGRSGIIIYRDGQPMLANPSSPPHSPKNVPKIHITFPDEQDDQGQRKSGRVMVIHVGDATVGMEPLGEEQLPVYEKESGSQFYAVDLEKIGGLKEKQAFN